MAQRDDFFVSEKVLGVYAKFSPDTDKRIKQNIRYFPSFFDSPNPLFRASAIITAPPILLLGALSYISVSLFWALKSFVSLIILFNPPQALQDIKESGNAVGLALFVSLLAVTSPVANLMSFIGGIVVSIDQAIVVDNEVVFTCKRPLEGITIQI